MFDLLRRKISEFTEKIKRSVDEKKAEAARGIGPKRELKAKIGVRQRVKKAVKGKIKIEEGDIRKLLEDFELALLEADVEQGAAKEIAGGIKTRLVGMEVSRGEDAGRALKGEIKKMLSGLMEAKGINLMEEISKKRPYVMLFLGPNGAGKSTSMAKLTKYLQERGKKVIWAAADTFRAASMEQLEKHAERLGVRVVKHNYGSDPAAVAFDAVRAAEAGGIDVVMIDSAGRQETNRNLMEELKKINRVAKADLRIYVGEAFTGQALLGQASEFDKALGIDGFVLSKMDADAKGGTAISLLSKLHKPVLFIGTGQEYKDLEEFSPEYIINRVLG